LILPHKGGGDAPARIHLKADRSRPLLSRSRDARV
jgi:hypothetical protein